MAKITSIVRNNEDGSATRTIAEMERLITSYMADRETFRKGKVLAYTQTFTKVYRKRPKGQFCETATWITRTLERSTDFILCPEWRTTNGSIHYHGVIAVKDRIKWLKSTLPSLRIQGFVCIKPIDNLQKWITYFLKEALEAQEIVGLPMPMFDRVVPMKKPSALLEGAAVEDPINLVESEAKDQITGVGVRNDKHPDDTTAPEISFNLSKFFSVGIEYIEEDGASSSSSESV